MGPWTTAALSAIGGSSVHSPACRCEYASKHRMAGRCDYDLLSLHQKAANPHLAGLCSEFYDNVLGAVAPGAKNKCTRLHCLLGTILLNEDHLNWMPLHCRLCLQKWVIETKTEICMHLQKLVSVGLRARAVYMARRDMTWFAVLPDSMITLTAFSLWHDSVDSAVTNNVSVRDQTALTAVNNDARYIQSVFAVQASIGTSAVKLAMYRSSIENLRNLRLIVPGSASDLGWRGMQPFALSETAQMYELETIRQNGNNDDRIEA